MHFEVRHCTGIYSQFSCIVNTPNTKLTAVQGLFTNQRELSAPLHILQLNSFISNRETEKDDSTVPLNSFCRMSLGRVLGDVGGGGGRFPCRPHRKVFVFFSSCPARGVPCPQVSDKIYFTVNVPILDTLHAHVHSGTGEEGDSLFLALRPCVHEVILQRRDTCNKVLILYFILR